MIRVVVVDDQELVRTGCEMVVEAQPDMTVVGSAGDGATALQRLAEIPADVVLMDIRMPGGDGIDTTRRLLQSPGHHPRVLVLTTFDLDEYVLAALHAGASGFVVKDAPVEQLADAVRRVHAGLRVVDPALAEASLFEGANPLSDRERQILRLAADGRSAAAIASEVYLSAGTVRNNLSSAIGKAGASNRAQAVRIAQDKGWI